MRLKCADFLDGLAKASRSTGDVASHPPPPDAALLRAYLDYVAAGPAAQLDAVAALLDTMRGQVLDTLDCGVCVWALRVGGRGPVHLRGCSRMHAPPMHLTCTCEVHGGCMHAAAA